MLALSNGLSLGTLVFVYIDINLILLLYINSLIYFNNLLNKMKSNLNIMFYVSTLATAIGKKLLDRERSLLTSEDGHQTIQKI